MYSSVSGSYCSSTFSSSVLSFFASSFSDSGSVSPVYSVFCLSGSIGAFFFIFGNWFGLDCSSTGTSTTISSSVRDRVSSINSCAYFDIGERATGGSETFSVNLSSY